MAATSSSPVLGEDDLIDQFVDCLVLDADEIRLPSRPAASEPQKSRCSLPGEFDWREIADDDVVVEAVEPPRILGAIDHAEARLNAEPLEIGDHRLHDALE